MSVPPSGLEEHIKVIIEMSYSYIRVYLTSLVLNSVAYDSASSRVY